MNDDQLRAELDRRARSVRDVASLAPAVRSAIESRPAPVGASRLAPLAGLAGIAAALLLLVVALPRLAVPQPAGSPSPTASPSLTPSVVVLSAQQFADGVRSGRLRGDTVVVDGQVAASEPTADCTPPFLCRLGDLDGVNDFLPVYAEAVATLEHEANVAPGCHDSGPPFACVDYFYPWLWLPERPQDGLMLLTVQPNGIVVYLGRVTETDAALASSVDRARVLRADSRAPDDIVLVDGWLTGINAAFRCLVPLPGSNLDGLPSRYCTNVGWLMDAPERDPAEIADRAAGIELQAGAYDSFGPHPLPPNAGQPIPTHGVFALAPRLEGWCGDDQAPCWRWHVIARLSDTEEAPPATPALPTASPHLARMISCRGPSFGRFPNLVASILDSAGVVDFCEMIQPASAGANDSLLISNLDGDLTTIQFDWAGDPCAAQATFSIQKAGGGFAVRIVAASDGICIQPLEHHALRIHLLQPISAALFAFDTDSHPTPAPGFVRSAWWELAADERPTDASTDLSLVVYEAGCASGQSPEGRVEDPTIAYSATEVVITFTVRPRPGAQECPSAPGAPILLQLAEPLGKRALVDGSFGPVVLERDEEFLALSSSRVDETAYERLQARAGPDACISNVQYDRHVPTQAELETWAADLGPDSGFVPVGFTQPQAYLGDWLEAARAFGAIEAFEGRPKPWYILARLKDMPSGAIVDPALLVLVSLDPFPVSGGRTIWFRGFYQATIADPSCERPLSETSSTESSAGTFELTMSSDQREYVAGEPIDVEATLRYEGQYQTVQVSTLLGAVGPFFVEQLDGTLRMGNGGSLLLCRPDTVQNGINAYPFKKPFGPVDGPPSDPVLIAYYADPILRLPHGTWRITVWSRFSIGDCMGPAPRGGHETVSLDASVVVVVR